MIKSECGDCGQGTESAADDADEGEVEDGFELPQELICYHAPEYRGDGADTDEGVVGGRRRVFRKPQVLLEV